MEQSAFYGEKNKRADYSDEGSEGWRHSATRGDERARETGSSRERLKIRLNVSASRRPRTEPAARDRQTRPR